MAAKAQRAPNPMIAAALDYAARGWRVHPTHSINKKGGCTCGRADCVPKSNGKHPILSEWQIKATTNELELCSLWDRYPFANVAIATGEGSDLVLIDVDPESGGLESLRKLESDYGRLAASMTARSGSGGFHFYFPHPGIRIQNRAPIPGYPGIDVRGDGGYIMAPPSRHRSGNAYEWIEQSDELAHMPAALVEMLLSLGKTDRPVEALPVVEGRPGDPARWLHKATMKAAPGNRNETGLWLACQLRDDGIQEIEAQYLLLQYAAAVSQSGDPYTDSEALASLRQAYKTAPRDKARSAPRRIGPPLLPPTGDDGSDGPEDEADPHLTEYGDMLRFVAQHGADLLYSHHFKQWLVWDGKRHAPDQRGLIMKRAKQTIRQLFRDAADAEEQEERDRLVKHALRSETKKHMQAMIDLAQSERPVTPEELDADPWLFNVMNGTIDLRTGQLRPHNQSDLITKIVPVTYDPTARAPAWDAFLLRIFAGNTDLIDWIAKALGYALTGDTSEQAFFILHGGGSNGKSTFLDTILKATGDYGMSTPAETLMVTRNTAIPSDIARLKGARFVMASEGEDGQRLAESLVKKVTGGTQIDACFKYGEWFSYVPQFKMFFETNHRPSIRGTDEGIWRRIRLIPFEVKIPDEEKDLHLGQKLLLELPGILNWMIRGCLAWQREGRLGMPPEVETATAGYRAAMDHFGAFVEECCTRDERTQILAGVLYRAYVKWAEDNGEKALSQRRLGDWLTEHGIPPGRGNNNKPIRIGIQLSDS